MGGKTKHLEAIDEELGHEKIKDTTDGGACLLGHVGTYQKNTCSYAYQAHQVSIEERKAIYDFDLTVEELRKQYPESKIPTNAYTSKKGNVHPAYYAYHLEFPQKGDWYLEGPTRDNVQSTKVGTSIPKGKNFTQCYFPYWQNSHHLIPKGLFNDLIQESGVSEIIRSALLTAKYNLNYKVNTIILPQDKEVARLLKLPRHLIQMDPDPGEKNQTCNHPQYTEKVERKLQLIIDNYKELAIKGENEPCNEPVKVDLDKEKLNKLSRNCYKTILEFGAKKAGKPIDQVKKIKDFEPIL